MRKTNAVRVERSLLATRRSEATPEFASTSPWRPLRAEEELPVWHESSFDLRQGMDMSEEPLETLPGELREMFPKG
jgi:hypothetical protein